MDDLMLRAVEIKCDECDKTLALPQLGDEKPNAQLVHQADGKHDVKLDGEFITSQPE